MAKTEIEKPKETKEENRHLPILANGRGLALRSMDDMWRFACAVRDSGLAPSSFQRPEQIVIALQSGAELGLPPMRSLQSFCVVHGQARLWGDTPLALVRQSGRMEYIKEWIEGDIGKDLSKTPDEVKAVCETKRKGDPEPMRREFSVGDARRADLWNQKTKKGYDSVWMNYPKRLLQMRARALNLRDNFPDAFGGATIAEEYEGVEMPKAAPGPEAPSREDRKQAEDVTVKDTAEAVKEQLAACLEKFVGRAEFELGRPADIPGPMLREIFAKFATLALKDDKTDFSNPESFTLANLAQLQAHIEHEGLDEILHLFPLTAEEADANLEEKLKEWEYLCKCGHQFDKPGKGSKGVKICPKCLSKDIEHFSPEKVEVEK